MGVIECDKVYMHVHWWVCVGGGSAVSVHTYVCQLSVAISLLVNFLILVPRLQLSHRTSEAGP